MVTGWNARIRLCFLAALFVVVPAQGALFQVHVGTTGASGEAVMAFDLANGDPASNHHVAISGFVTDGDLLVCPSPSTCAAPSFLTTSPETSPVGAVITGTLPSTIVIYDTDIGGIQLGNPITYYQNITLGSYIDFDFEMLGDPTSAGDGLAFWLLDPETGSPILPDDNYLFLYTFGAESPCTSSDPDVTTCTEVQGGSAVPEPSALALAMAGLLGIGIARSKRIARVSVSASRG